MVLVGCSHLGGDEGGAKQILFKLMQWAKRHCIDLSSILNVIKKKQLDTYSQGAVGGDFSG